MEAGLVRCVQGIPLVVGGPGRPRVPGPGRSRARARLSRSGRRPVPPCARPWRPV